MTRALVYLVHASPVVRERYTAALAAVEGLEADLVFVNAGAYSGPYRALANKYRDVEGRILPGLMADHPPPRPRSAYQVIVGASFSAGYAFWREVLASRQDAAILDGVVGIDSWHASYDPDGTASDAQLASLLAFARRAQDEPLVCWIGHSDVRTPPPGHAQAFASTTAVADELVRLLGLVRDGEELLTGGLLVRAYDVRKSPTSEHVAALNEWGPVFLGDALEELLGRREIAGVVDPEPIMDELLGRLSLQLALEALGAKVKEIRGPRHHPEILRYFAGCERNGVNIGAWLQADEYAWCAAFASCMASDAARGNWQAIPHRWRAAVRELWADAIASGAAVAASRIRSGEVYPLPGDLWIGVRGGSGAGSPSSPFSTTAGKGHVGRIEVVPSLEAFTTVDGNVSDQVSRVVRSVEDKEFVGIIRYPHALDLPPPGDAELEELRRLIAHVTEHGQILAADLANYGRRLGEWALDA